MTVPEAVKINGSLEHSSYSLYNPLYLLFTIHPIILSILLQACEIPTDFRAEQCSAFDDVPYQGKLLKWYPYDDPTKPCSLICHGVSSRSSTLSTRDYDSSHQDDKNNKLTSEEESIEDSFTELDTDDSIVVQLADKVQDGTRCHTDSLDICIGGTCLVSLFIH